MAIGLNGLKISRDKKRAKRVDFVLIVGDTLQLSNEAYLRLLSVG
jgi:hypothetical protein